MSKQRRRYSAAFKFQVALKAAKGRKTVNEFASEFELHPNQINQWKQTLLKSGEALFQAPNDRSQQDQATQQAELFEQIGRLKMELEWIKKSSLRHRISHSGRSPFASFRLIYPP